MVNAMQQDNDGNVTPTQYVYMVGGHSQRVSFQNIKASSHLEAARIAFKRLSNRKGGTHPYIGDVELKGVSGSAQSFKCEIGRFDSKQQIWCDTYRLTITQLKRA